MILKERSHALFTAALQSIPGGVNSPVRAFKAVGETPVFFKSGKGPYLLDEDGQRYVDYVGGFGPAILGHADDDVVKQVQAATEYGFSFGAPTEAEILLAQQVIQTMPSIQMVRMVNSGTEATMTALRLARAYTKRERIVKFAGCYHGHNDSLLVSAGSGALTCGTPSSPGVPKSLAELTITVAYNDLDALKKVFALVGSEIATVILEPVVGNMGCVLPKPGFLEGVRELCDEYQSLLIFDEVMTGYRVALGGAQALYKIRPDLTTLGKVIGGGLPIGAIGGSLEIMSWLAPLGPVYQAGTLSGNPLAMHAGLATLKKVQAPGFHKTLAEKTTLLAQGIKAAAHKHSIPICVPHVPGMLSVFFTEQTQVDNLDQVLQCDTERFRQFFHGMLAEGVYLPPAAFEAWFISIAHDDLALKHTLAAIDRVFLKLSAQ